MTNRPQVSVVIPCFNDGRFLRASLKSVSSQTHPPMETLVVNDGSTDAQTIKLLQQVEAPTVRVITQDNRGPAAARNTGIRHAKGDFIYFLDADDLIHPECLATLARMLEESNDAVAAVSKIRLLGGSAHGTAWGEACNAYLILVENQWAAGFMLRRRTVEQHDIWYDESMHQGLEDWELHIRLAKTGKPILFCPKALYTYRIRRTSRSVTARTHYAEVARYIRDKHRDSYVYEKLLDLKRSHAPGMLILDNHAEKNELAEWLNNQTFTDWVLAGDGTPLTDASYRFFYSDVDALCRLPPEALECSLMALECYRQLRNCVIAARKNCLSLFATAATVPSLDGNRRPVALISRTSPAGLHQTVSDILSNCELIIEFPDQKPESKAGWEQNLIRFAGNSKAVAADDVDVFRKNLSSLGKRMLGGAFHRLCVQAYDNIYYRMLCSDALFEFRRKIESALGSRAERSLSTIFYGLFLIKPPVEEEIISRRIEHNSSKSVSPLFITRPDERIHILIATAWLIEGGVEQIIFELCRQLDPTRFRFTIVTTLPSFHAWDGVAREAGVSVYHLADFLKPSEMTKGFLHLVFTHHVDCLYIMNSQMAYRAARTLKRIAQWLPIIDRIEAPDPGGGYPMFSAKVGKESIDLRTVSHNKLAEDMYNNYGLPRGSLRVIYIGVNLSRIDHVLAQPRGRLHEQCNVSRETPIVIFVGRLAEQKRPEVFVRSVAEILRIDSRCKAHFAMVGDGKLMGSVERLISKHELRGRIHLLGAHDTAVELLADATILMMPSGWEGVALVSYEAMALGVPQIFANVNGQPELITPETGILIDNGSGEEIRYAKACLDLLSDPARRERMAEAGKQRIRAHFTAEKAVAEYANIFEELGEQSRRRAKEIPHLRPPHINPLHELA